jgi:hypothetical protein
MSCSNETIGLPVVVVRPLTIRPGMRYTVIARHKHGNRTPNGGKPQQSTLIPSAANGQAFKHKTVVVTLIPEKDGYLDE